MQKLELRNNLNSIVKRLKSIELIKFLDATQVEKNQLLRIIIESKGGYDQAISEKLTKQVFELFETEKVYNTNFFSELVSFISKVPDDRKHRTQFLSNPHVNDFYSYHKSLVVSYNLIDNLLLNSKELYDSENNFNIVSAQKNDTAGN